MKTLKISVVATLASLVSWWLHLPRKVWPEHPFFADVLLGLALCIMLQFAWTDPKPATTRDSENS